jgi:hypothetical protein
MGARGAPSGLTAAVRINIRTRLVDLAPQVTPFVGRQAPAAAKRLCIVLRVLLVLRLLVAALLVVLTLLTIIVLTLLTIVALALIILTLLTLVALPLDALCALRFTLAVTWPGLGRGHGRHANQAACGKATDE